MWNPLRKQKMRDLAIASTLKNQIIIMTGLSLLLKEEASKIEPSAQGTVDMAAVADELIRHSHRATQTVNRFLDQIEKDK